MTFEQPALPRPSRLARAAWLLGGLLAVGVGAVGIVVPGLPTTVCFIIAAWCFSHSSERLERWVLGLPRIGPMVRDHRAGLGMPRRAKIIAMSMIAVAVGLSVTLAIGAWTIRLVVLGLGAIGIAYIAIRVPTRERVLQRRALRDAPRATAPDTSSMTQ
jgi:uncharacterized membrane protein YbaN (DUF454 family)